MKVVLAGLAVPSLNELLRQGVAHPRFGELFRRGSWARLQGVAEGWPTLAAKLERAARRAGVEVASATASESGSPGPRLTLDADGDALASALAQGNTATEPVHCLLIRDEQEASSLALWLSGSLPSEGPLPAATWPDFEATVLGWLGVVAGRSLPASGDGDWDLEQERKLTERLRQLYGD